MTVLQAMRPATYAAFAEETANAYAQDCVNSLRWEPEGAVERARAELQRLLPQGLATPDHHLCEILDRDGGETVGGLWFAVTEVPDGRTCWLYDVRIAPPRRGQGHARAALLAMEARAVAFGAGRIALHVFSFNASALALYRSMGYGISGYNMVRRLVRD